MKFAVFADDLTGASASAGSLAWGLGLPITVSEQLPRDFSGPLVLNTRSREEPDRSGFIAPWVTRLWDQGYRDFDKRIDTTLRGPAPAELAQLIEALPEEPWVGVIAAYPSADRTTMGGRQYLYGKAVTTQLPEVANDCLTDYLFWRSAQVRVVLTEELRQNAQRMAVELSSFRRVIFDVTSEDDLGHIGQILHHVRGLWTGPIVTVTSGAVLTYYPGHVPERVAVIVGSPTVTNLQQIDYLLKQRAVSLLALAEPISPDSVNSLIVLHSGLTPVKAAHRQPIAAQLADQAGERLSDLRRQGWVPERIIVTGGEMAQAFLDGTHAVGTQVVRLLAPLVGQGIIRGGEYHAAEIVTKGGMVGSEALLYQLTLAPSVNHTDIEGGVFS